MTEIIHSKFKVKSVQETDICVKHVETGLTVFIETHKYLYDDSDVWEQVNKISENDIVKLEIESQNDMNTTWVVQSVGSVQSSS